LGSRKSLLLEQAMAGQDIVYANLPCDDIDAQAANIVNAMKSGSKDHLYSSLGIYDEVPGKFGAWNRRQIGAYLPSFSPGSGVSRQAKFPSPESRAVFCSPYSLPVAAPDTIAQFKAQTGNYDAAYGRGAGANVDARAN
jgi:hypothetical protein